MHIADFLSPDDALCDVRASDKDRLLQELTQRAAKALQPRCRVARPTRSPSASSSARPEWAAASRFRTRASRACQSRSACWRGCGSAIEFAAIDGKPVDIVFLLLLPAAPHGEQLTALASVARKLRDAEVAARLRGARDGGEIFRVMCDDR